MSRVEREALVHCAKDAVILLDNFDYNSPVENPHPGKSVDVVPAVRSMKDDDGLWYYDEATCSQLVYMYGEVGQNTKDVAVSSSISMENRRWRQPAFNNCWIY